VNYHMGKAKNNMGTEEIHMVFPIIYMVKAKYHMGNGRIGSVSLPVWRAGYFAALYYKVTAKVKEGIYLKGRMCAGSSASYTVIPSRV
jgi:hypothetical protein